MTTATVSPIEQHQLNEHALLGESLIASQKVELALYDIIAKLAKAHSNSHGQQILDLNVNTFLREQPSQQEDTLALYEELFGDQLPMQANEIRDFIYRRNIVSRSFWRVTGADIKGGEKLANPTVYLEEFLSKCAHWQGALKTQ